MKNLLKLELRKIRKQKSFYVCTLVMVGLLFLSVLTSDALSKNPELAGQFSSSCFDIIVSALNSSSFLLVAGIFVALCVCNDYEQETIKNIYARGYSRKRVYFSKLISVWISTTIMFTVVMLCAFIFGRAYFGTANLEESRLIYIIGVQYTVCMANIFLFFFVSSLIRKNGLSIAATIVVPMIINMLLGMLDSFMKFKDFSTADFWVSSFMGEISTVSVTDEKLSFCLIASLAYILVFPITGAFSHKKIEL